MLGRKGFSVFTPMVGTLVILITFLIVASMLESEKWNFQGLTETYQTIQLTGISQEAQDRFVSTIRDTILTELETNMKVEIDQCRNDSVVDEFFPSDDRKNETCEIKALNSVKNQSYITVSGFGLSSSYLEALISSITDKYSLAKVNTNLCAGCQVNDGKKTCLVWVTGKNGMPVSITEVFDRHGNYLGCQGKNRRVNPGEMLDQGTCPLNPCVDPTSTIKSTSLLSCDLDPSELDWDSIKQNCEDGRISVTADFTEIADSPIGTIKSNASQYTELKIYLPNETKSFITNDPLGFYALVLAKVFQNFTILDPTWHHVGGTDDHSTVGEEYGYMDNGYGNGSQWYHYKYAVQVRVPKNDKGYKGKDGWAGSIGNATQTMLASYNDGPVDFSVDDPYRNPLVDLADGNDKETNDNNLRLDNAGGCSGSGWESDCGWKYLWEYFDFGISNKGTEEMILNFSFLADYFKDVVNTSETLNHIFPGGYLDSDTSISGSGNAFTTNANKGLLSEFDKSHYIAANTTNQYDKKFFNDPSKFLDNSGKAENDPLAKATRMIREHLEKPTLKASAGYAMNDPIIVNVTVNSDQYYLCNGTEGGDNWFCGQAMFQYIPYITDITNDLTKNSNYLSDKGAWFLSLPVNMSCYTCTLYRVEEEYTVTRNSHEYLDTVNKTVFRIKFTRWKEDYSNPGSGKALWVPGVDSSWIIGDNAHKIIVRHGVYSCQADESKTICTMHINDNVAANVTSQLNQFLNAS